MFEELKAAFKDGDPFKSWLPFIAAGVVFLVTTFKAYMGGQYCPNTVLIEDLVVIITGADGGIGEEIVKELTKRSAQIVMACKMVENGEKVKKQILKQHPTARIEVRNLDLRSFDNVRRFVKGIENDHKKVDVLINNAGVTFVPYKKTVDGFETHLQVNYLSHFLLTYLLQPLLKKSTQGRVINVSAHAYSAGKMNIDDPLGVGNMVPVYHARDAFSHSKLAIILWTTQLAKILKSTSITVNALTPGIVRGTKHMRHSPIMRAFMCKCIMFPWMWLFMKKPVLGAQTMIYLATQPTISTTTGAYFNDCEQNDVVEIAKDEQMADKLYAETLRVLKLEKKI